MPATAPAPQHNATREYGHVAVQPNAPLHRQQIIQEVAYQPNAAPHQAPWQNYNAITHQAWQATPHWWYGNQTGGWEWNPQPGWVATWHWHEGQAELASTRQHFGRSAKSKPALRNLPINLPHVSFFGAQKSKKETA